MGFYRYIRIKLRNANFVGILFACNFLIAHQVNSQQLNIDSICHIDLLLIEHNLDQKNTDRPFYFKIETADTPEERASGLMFREKMANDAGMLFVYSKEQHTRFWMKNTPLSLDIIFADKDGVIQVLHENTTPYSMAGIDGGDGIQFVLELNAGMVENLDIKSGDRLLNVQIPDSLSKFECKS